MMPLLGDVFPAPGEHAALVVPKVQKAEDKTVTQEDRKCDPLDPLTCRH
jgi:hypothetical protein